MSIFNKKFLVGCIAAIIMADAVVPAMAQPWGPPPPPRYGWHRPPPGPGWGPPPRWRRHCWMEERRVRVDTPWGPRWRIRNVRVCR
ncbi:MAG: hypothetical protein GX458_04625 [Phyllobacteriaceae bacterium]|nr:hypothetical protein [Phyllobacteriaceae bacterium]